MSTAFSMFASLSPSYIPEIRRQSMGRLFGASICACRERAALSIEEAARLSGMEISEWAAIEEGQVPRETARLQAMAATLEISWQKMLNMVVLCRDAWEL